VQEEEYKTGKVEENYKVKGKRNRGRPRRGRRCRKKDWHCFLCHRLNIWVAKQCID